MSHPKPRRPPPRRAPSLAPWLLISGGVLILGITGWLALRNSARAKPEVSGAPRLKIDRDNVNLGEVKLGQTVEVAFELANVGDETLRLTEPPYVEVAEGC